MRVDCINYFGLKKKMPHQELNLELYLSQIEMTCYKLTRSWTAGGSVGCTSDC